MFYSALHITSFQRHTTYKARSGLPQSTPALPLISKLCTFLSLNQFCGCIAVQIHEDFERKEKTNFKELYIEFRAYNDIITTLHYYRNTAIHQRGARQAEILLTTYCKFNRSLALFAAAEAAIFF